VSFESVKQKGRSKQSPTVACSLRGRDAAAMRLNNLEQVHKMLESGYTSIPQPQDTEKFVNPEFLPKPIPYELYRPKYYVPRNPFQTPPYYPQSPHHLLSTAGIFSQLDVETLFYVFYYLPGTYQQYGSR